MSAPASSRFAVAVKGIPRTLLSVREQDSGRLIVTIQGAGNKLRDLGIPLDQQGTSTKHNVRIAHQKFSIHLSDGSLKHNQLHFHQVSANGEKKDGYHVTNAIGSGRFAPLFAKRYSDLQSSAYDLKKATNVTKLGAYDTNKFTLVACVFIAHRDRVFDLRAYDFSCVQVPYKCFRLVILVSFFLLVPHQSSMLIGASTLRPEEALNDEDRKFRESMMTGYDAQGAAQYFQSLREMMREEALGTALKAAPQQFAQTPVLLDLARFELHPVPKTPS
jgi:hypothetical protein